MTSSFDRVCIQYTEEILLHISGRSVSLLKRPVSQTGAVSLALSLPTDLGCIMLLEELKMWSIPSHGHVGSVANNIKDDELDTLEPSLLPSL